MSLKGAMIRFKDGTLHLFCARVVLGGGTVSHLASSLMLFDTPLHLFTTTMIFFGPSPDLFAPSLRLLVGRLQLLSGEGYLRSGGTHFLGGVQARLEVFKGSYWGLSLAFFAISSSW
ncbi:MAG: hypothetical protein JXR10_02410 [Cyclobacteriaceae bacterium]